MQEYLKRQLATQKCRLNLPLVPLVPYTEPKIEDRTIIDQFMFDLLDMSVDEAAKADSKNTNPK